jgi:hypothetical protein
MSVASGFNHVASRAAVKAMLLCLLFCGSFGFAACPANNRDVQGQTPLHRAAAEGLVGEVNSLVLCGAEVNARDFFGQTPLLLATWKGHEDIVKVLLQHGARADATDGNGYTALHFAVSYDRPGIVRLLLDAQAPVNATGVRNDTPLCLARRAENDSLAQLLREHGATEGECAAGGDAKLAFVDEVVILPVVDARNGQDDKVNLRKLRHRVRENLARKHYSAIEADKPPANSRWVMRVSVDGVRKGLEAASLTVALCDRQLGGGSDGCPGKMVWFKTSTGRYDFIMGDGAPAQLADVSMTPAYPGWDQQSVYADALDSVLIAFPSKVAAR